MTSSQATFSDLPDEIAQEISISCLDELQREVQHLNQDEDTPALSTYPLLFTSVCQHWKSLALTCPRLWSTISVVVCHPGGKDMEESTPPLPVVEKWIERSSSMPLTFSIKRCGKSCWQGWDSQNGFKPVLELFLPHHLRWKRAFMDLGQIRAVLSLLRTSSSSMHYPELQQISLHSQLWFNVNVEGDSAGLAYLLNHAPRLVVLSVQLHPLRSQPYRPLDDNDPRRPALDSILAAIPWSQLEELSYLPDSFTPLRSLEILGRDCPNLRFGMFRVLKHLEDEHEADDLPNLHQSQRTKSVEYPLVSHNHLLALHLLPASIDVSIIILKHTKLPKLRELMLSWLKSSRPHREVWKEKVLADEFEKFVRRSGCALEVLRYHDQSPSFSEQEGAFAPPILHCLRSVSTSLRELSVQAYNTDALLEALELTVRGRPKSNHILCPNLDTIRLTSYTYQGNGLLADMVESRWNPSKELLLEKLRRVNVMFMFGNPFDGVHGEVDVQRLQALSGDGSGRKISLIVVHDGNDTKYV